MTRYDLIGLIGALLILLGISAVYWPAALIAAGLMSLFVSVRGPKA